MDVVSKVVVERQLITKVYGRLYSGHSNGQFPLDSKVVERQLITKVYMDIRMDMVSKVVE